MGGPPAAEEGVASRHTRHRKPECTTTQHRSQSTHSRRHTHTRVHTTWCCVTRPRTTSADTQHCRRARASCPDSDPSLGACQTPRHNVANVHSHRNTRTHGCCTGYKRIPMANSHRNNPDLASQLDHLPLSPNRRLLTWPTGTLANRPRHLCSAVSLCVHPHLLCIPPGGRMESNGGVGHPLSAPLIPEKGQLKVGCSPFTAGNTGRASWSDPVSQQ